MTGLLACGELFRLMSAFDPLRTLAKYLDLTRLDALPVDEAERPDENQNAKPKRKEQRSRGLEIKARTSRPLISISGHRKC
jgi:hypothetical protein